VSCRLCLIPHWAKDASGAASTINARSETAATKPAFRDPIKFRRCLIPADGFYEWAKTGKSKQPYCFEVNDGNLFAFAALWDGLTQQQTAQIIEEETARFQGHKLRWIRLVVLAPRVATAIGYLAVFSSVLCSKGRWRNASNDLRRRSDWGKVKLTWCLMLNRTLQNRIERAEQAAKEQSKFSSECICFPQNEQPFFGFPLKEQIAAKVKCPHHGDRFRLIFHIYVPKWGRDNEKKVRWFRLSEQYHKAWHASFPPDLWPGEEEETADGRTLLRLKDGTTLFP
jgi:hypothetical protein